MRLTGPVELRVAANADMMLVVRLATAGVTARAGLTLDAMDGFKMAAEEARRENASLKRRVDELERRLRRSQFPVEEE